VCVSPRLIVPSPGWARKINNAFSVQGNAWYFIGRRAPFRRTLRPNSPDPGGIVTKPATGERIYRSGNIHWRRAINHDGSPELLKNKAIAPSVAQCASLSAYSSFRDSVGFLSLLLLATATTTTAVAAAVTSLRLRGGPRGSGSRRNAQEQDMPWQSGRNGGAEGRVKRQ
jgi:hypothetical protein